MLDALLISLLANPIHTAPSVAPAIWASQAAPQAANAETISVDATGSGSTESEALQQALMSAVSSAVGTLIDAETVVENDKVIKDRILSATNGFVEKYEKLESRRDGEGWTVKVRATVRSGTLRERLDQTIHRSTSPVDGQNLGQRIRNKQKVAEDQGTLLRSALGECCKGVLKVERIGDPVAVDGADLGAGMVRLRIAVRISIDDKAWRTRMDKAKQALDAIAIAKSSVQVPIPNRGPVEEMHDPRGGSVRADPRSPGKVMGAVLASESLARKDGEADPLRRGLFLPDSWCAGVETGSGAGALESKIAAAVPLEKLVAESRARRQALAVACILDRAPGSASVMVHSYVLPAAVVEGSFDGFTGGLRLRASALDGSGAAIASEDHALGVLGGWNLDRGSGFSGGVSVSGMLQQAFLLAGLGRMDLLSNPSLGERLSLTHGAREQNPAILAIAPGAAYLNPCGQGCYAGMAVVSSWTGSMYLDISDAALESMATLQLEIEPR